MGNIKSSNTQIDFVFSIPEPQNLQREARSIALHLIPTCRSIPSSKWLTTTPWAKAMNGPEWAFPVVESLHFIGLALSVGTIAIMALIDPWGGDAANENWE
jgi:hypothetical protein